MSPSPTTTAMPTMNGGPRRNSTGAHASSATRRSQEKSFHESGRTKFYSAAAPGRVASCNCRGKEPDSGRRSAARGLRQYGPIEKGGGYARSERATHRRGSPVTRSLPLVLGNPRRAAQRGARK